MNEKKFNRIYQENYMFIYDAAKRLVGPDNADDVTQETMLSVWLNLKNFRNDCQLTSWIYKIMLNKCLMLIRKKEFEPLNIDKMISPKPETYSNYVIAKLTVAKIMPQLLPKYQKFLALHYLEELECKEIAEKYGVTKGYVSGALCRARIQARTMTTI